MFVVISVMESKSKVNKKMRELLLEEPAYYISHLSGFFLYFRHISESELIDIYDTNVKFAKQRNGRVA